MRATQSCGDGAEISIAPSEPRQVPAPPSGHHSLLLTPAENREVEEYEEEEEEEEAQESYSLPLGGSHVLTNTRTRFKILDHMIPAYRWILNFMALFIYGLLIFPGLIQVAWRYFFDKRIRRNIAYGEEPRNHLDLYLPENIESPKPVVAFVTGGAWIIGYKAWGSLLALQLLQEDVIVACIDYRNFPQGTISDMVQDVSQGISFICNNISAYGGDLDRLYLVGQSAGAHLGACALTDQVKKQIDRGDIESVTEPYHSGNEDSLLWTPSQFKAYIGISGGYDLYKLSQHIRSKGLSQGLFFRIMEGEESLLRYSPELRLRSMSKQNAGSLLPPIYLLHGTDDHSIPHSSSISFVDTLISSGAKAEVVLYEGKSHTDLFLQDPMRGGRDAVLEEICSIMRETSHNDGNNGNYDSRRLQRRMVPEILLKLAHKISPF